MTWVRYPRGSSTLVVPGPRRDAAAGAAMLGYSRRAVLAAHAASWAAVRCGGIRLLPVGTTDSLEVPSPAALHALGAAWSAALGTVRPVAVHPQRQRERAGFVALLTRDGRPFALVKCRDRAEDLVREERLLRQVARGDGAVFVTPRVLASGATGGWWWLAMTAMPSRPHRPAPVRRPGALPAVLREILARLRSTTRPDTVPEHWQPAHNDLAPWNLRRTAGRTWLLDWETAGFAPPGADRLYARASYAALGYRLPRPAPPVPEETVAWWEARLLQRPTDDVDAALTTALLRQVRSAARR